MARKRRGALQLRVFLSHRYKSVRENLYFSSILSSFAEFQFEVDVGKKPTNVTRLEMLMRNCDGIVGIFAFPDDEELPGDEAGRISMLRSASAYFRLETDLAIRSRKPTLLYVDQRYQRLFRLPKGFHVEWFNAQEVQSPGVSPSRSRFQKACDAFCKEVAIHKDYELIRKAEVDPHNVAVILGSQDESGAYAPSIVDRICETLAGKGIGEPKVVRCPRHAVHFQTGDLDALSWCFADVGPALFRTGMIGYMHGRFIPMLRAVHSGGRTPETIAEYRSLYVGIEKGYDSDLIKWESAETLLSELRKRLEVIFLDRTLIASSADAERYFKEAARRKEAVFLSYSGEDHDAAIKIRQALESRFQDVFDYKVEGAIGAGRHWLEEIDIRLQRAAVGVQLISTSYFKSAHCMQEAQIMNSLWNQKRMAALIPIKLSDGEIEGMPQWLAAIEYLRLYRYQSPDAAVAEILKRLDAAA